MSFLIALIQIVVYVICKIGTFFLPLSFKYRLEKNEFKKGNILVANHVSRLDFLFIYLGIPFKNYIKMLPLYALTADKYMNTWWKKLALSSVGCISINTHSKENSALGLLALFDKVQQNNTILLFPEGRVKKESTLEPFLGIGYMLKKNNKRFLPINISVNTTVTTSAFLMGKYPVKIIYGKPRKAIDSSIEEISHFVMKTIYFLT